MFWSGPTLRQIFDVASLSEDRHSPSARDVGAQLRRAQFKSMNDVLPLIMGMAAIGTVLLYLVLTQMVPSPYLNAWLAWRLATNAVRAAFAVLSNRGVIAASPRNLRIYAALACVDGLSWGAMGWLLTPVARLDVATITLTMTVIVACVGALGLHVHVPSAVAFVLPVTLPTGVHALGRHDQLGVLCCAAMVGLSVVLLCEMVRFNRRFMEILRLRFESEETAQAKTQALQQAHELAQTRSRFVATMSHEIRTPLHGLLGLLQLVHKAEHMDDARRHLALMQSTGDHLVKVINEVLEHARMGATGLPVHAQPFKLRELLDELADIAGLACQDKGLRFRLDTDLGPEACVSGDATRIRQVMHNLLGNALKFTAEGDITLEATRDPDTGHVRMVVRDTGVGIPPGEVERIFEPFHQAAGTYERRFGGTGLGLTISRQLCEAMGGTLSCTSEPGRGSAFVCELPLPLIETQGTAPARSALRLAPSGVNAGEDRVAPGDEGERLTGRVLLVEDNPVNTLVAEANLKRLGLQVTAVDSGEAALAWLDQHHADLIFMDCEMPGLDGIQTTRRIRALERATRRTVTPIVAMTASGRDTYEERCVPAGMNDYLSKPFAPQALREVVQRQLLCMGQREQVAVG